jgi:hypothetical protein
VLFYRLNEISAQPFVVGGRTVSSGRRLGPELDTNFRANE